MFSEKAVDEFALGARTPEGIDTIVSANNLIGISEVSGKERKRILETLDKHPTVDDYEIRGLYGIAL